MANKSLEELLVSIKKYPKPAASDDNELDALLELVKPELDAIAAQFVKFEDPGLMIEAVARVKMELSTPESPFSRESDTYGFLLALPVNVALARSMNEQHGVTSKHVDLMVGALLDEGVTLGKSPRVRRQP